MRQLLLLFIALFSFVGCLKDDDYTVSVNDRLAFSKDTIKFDTIISGIPTKTYSMAVYNPANKAIRISQIALQKVRPLRLRCRQMVQRLKMVLLQILRLHERIA